MKTSILLRDRSVVDHRTHIPVVPGSIPGPATSACARPPAKSSELKIQSRIALLRMTYIRLLILRQVPFNAKTLAVELEVHPKTISRDIDFMKDFLNYEIHFDSERNTYFGTVPPVTTL